MPIISVRQLWKGYADNTVLERVSLRVESNEFIVIVGASGCGKSTFLRLLLGDERPDRGSIELDGEPLPAEPNRDRGIVFQRYSVFPHLTVLGNLLLGAELRQAKILGRCFGRARAQARADSEAMLARVGLLPFADQYPVALSGGMQQRLALAQALVGRPRILLLDEPFGALDPGIRKDMHELVRELHRELALTVLMTTHDLSEGFTLGTRLLVFDKTCLEPSDAGANGATITYDIPLNGSSAVQTNLNGLNPKEALS
ncbi:MAG: ATP-binding cassette domain-containing protein [Gammaproteobacteria bacterium]|nr:ATP-binding cassette domain-containing protein [Gammaproteobacteria bacterium]